MNNKIKAAAALVIAAGCLGAASGSACAQTVAALPAQAQPIAHVGEARPLPAWTDFCRNFPGECAVDPTEPAVVTLTPRMWQTIVAVNRKVNGTIKPMLDSEHWGVADRWDLAADGYGDCEDFQLLKRKMLADAGLPRRAMRMTVVIDEKNEGHAVLMIRTSQGDFTLDNKTDEVLPWSETGYIFVKRESQDAVAWVSLGRAASPTVTANRR
ncbi:transglutaminase-like cysteine peptidase [Enterovirga aerilata]|uniref:Transglutaminase-like cysteine peptidase n=1 Tax=Enterovirga aerilata TaxID=2730920 RepID=A0A849I7J7_9HYPH|nr:transglutaminase-like cysteine peptidase [Enterovirga sp. DB1703]NNM73261.1 transglutaminase-like cysteine peptidase [Enterovirga sp. DB1703]